LSAYSFDASKRAAAPSTTPDDVPAYYRVRRSTSPLDDGIDTWLSIHTPRDVASNPVEETLSIEVTVTNDRTGEQETVRLVETGPDTGVCAQVFQAPSHRPPAEPLTPSQGSALPFSPAPNRAPAAGALLRAAQAHLTVEPWALRPQPCPHRAPP
jgi:type VI protein secretion system component VasA